MTACCPVDIREPAEESRADSDLSTSARASLSEEEWKARAREAAGYLYEDFRKLPEAEQELLRQAVSEVYKDAARISMRRLGAEWLAVVFKDLSDRPVVVAHGELETWPTELRQEELSRKKSGKTVFMLWAPPDVQPVTI